MLVFLDTEFTDFKSPDLLSLALVSEDGREFYCERTDYSLEDCSVFVRETVLPLFGRVSGAVCTSQQLTQRLRDWFRRLPETATLIYDYSGDIDLFIMVASGCPTMDLGQPVNIGQKIQLDENTICDPIFSQGLNFTFTREWPPHHALADARALMAGYRVWRSYIEGVWA